MNFQWAQEVCVCVRVVCVVTQAWMVWGGGSQEITCAVQERIYIVFLILHKLPSCSGIDLGGLTGNGWDLDY